MNAPDTSIRLTVNDVADVMVAEMRAKLLTQFLVLAARFEADIRRQVRRIDWAEFAGDPIAQDAPRRPNGEDSWGPY